MAAAAACLVLRFVPLEAADRGYACGGILLAWGASAPGTWMLAAGMRSTARAFWWAFGAGIFLRAAVLAVLMAYAWRHPEVSWGALLGAYGLGIAGLLLIEYRSLIQG